MRLVKDAIYCIYTHRIHNQVVNIAFIKVQALYKNTTSTKICKMDGHSKESNIYVFDGYFKYNKSENTSKSDTLNK